jgi:hypothetical protein
MDPYDDEISLFIEVFFKLKKFNLINPDFTEVYIGDGFLVDI